MFVLEVKLMNFRICGCFSKFRNVKNVTMNAHLVFIRHKQITNNFIFRACNSLFTTLEKSQEAIEITNEDHKIQVQLNTVLVVTLQRTQ